MRIKALALPAFPADPVSWRSLHLAAAFQQRSLIGMSELSRLAQARGLTISTLGRSTLEDWDRTGVLRPIAFALAGWTDLYIVDPAALDTVRFREAEDFRSWTEYEYEIDNIQAVSPLYSPWQILCMADALNGREVEVPLDVLLDPSSRDSWTTQVGVFLEEQHKAMRSLDDRWRPVLKLLTGLQNRFWPSVSGRVVMPWDLESKQRYDPTIETRRRFDPLEILARHELDEPGLATVYDWLCQRGARIEGGPGGFRTIGGDRWARLRLLADRSVRRDLRGPARLAMDFYEAAEMIGRWWFELTGRYLPAVDEAPHRRTTVPIDRDTRTDSTHSRSPAAVRAALRQHGLWTGRVHVIVEGRTEVSWVKGLVQSALGGVPEALLITDLEGVGGVKRIESIVETVIDYATASALILDDEGEAMVYTQKLISAGLLNSRFVLRVGTSFEEHNFSDAELVAAVRYVAAHPPGNRAAAKLTLTARELRTAHVNELANAKRGQEPGLANTLLKLANRPEHGAVNLKKIELSDELLRRTLRRLEDGQNRKRELERPIVRFVFDRVATPLGAEIFR